MRTQSQAKRKVNYKSTDRVFHAAVPPNPRLRRGLKKEWGLVARKTTLVVCNCVWQLTPLYSKVDQGESAAEGGIPPPQSQGRLKRPCDQGGGMPPGICKTTFPSANFICETTLPRAKAEISRTRLKQL